jgi:excisionase family DNA binding protein
MSEKYMTAPEVADHCRVSVWTIYARVKAGMPHGRIGNRLLFDVAEVDAWIRNHRAGAAPVGAPVPVGAAT